MGPRGYRYGAGAVRSACRHCRCRRPDRLAGGPERRPCRRLRRPRAVARRGRSGLRATDGADRRCARSRDLSAGDGGMIDVRVFAAPLDVAAETAAAQAGGSGALATFIGSVRADDGVTELMLEHYPGATERALAEVAGTA